VPGQHHPNRRGNRAPAAFVRQQTQVWIAMEDAIMQTIASKPGEGEDPKDLPLVESREKRGASSENLSQAEVQRLVINTKAKEAHDLETIVTEYREKSFLYYNFCATMHNLLVNLLDNKGFRYQISNRVKALDSIKEKIERNETKGKIYRRLSDIEDLAGVRIVFNLESDKRRFVRALYKEFTPEKMKIEEHHKRKGYRSTHVLAQFGKKRLRLNEYHNFAGLKCELQLTSALYHAWSEIEHDIFYKRDPHLKSLDQETVRALRKELEDVMINYIQSASETFEALDKKIRRIRLNRSPSNHLSERPMK
jgi:ppGpp synthetase/RelA/SpoT-type nucleotidyltranferase